MKTKERGLTIIELLITITIIGILTSVILAALNDARLQGREAKIISEVDSLIKRAEIEKVAQGNYTMVCGYGAVLQGEKFAELITSINSFATGSVVCNSDINSFAVSVPLGTTHWCVDSTGAKKEIPDALVIDTDYSCPP